MNKQVKTYLLLGLVLVVWGTIAYKVYSALDGDAEVPRSDISQGVFAKPNLPLDTFSLQADYRDPFLGTFPKTKAIKSTKPVVKVNPWDQVNVEFTGSIEASQKEGRIYFLSINGNQHIFKKGKTKASITLISGSKDQVRLSYNGLQKVIQRTQ
jgi:hypothetical protein